MAEIDPVILQLRADVDRYLRDLRRAQGDTETRIRRMEQQFRQSSSAISLSLSGIAATLAAGFTGRELVGLIDQFTRFQNSLKVAGLEGENLIAVQERLFQTGAKYGVSVNALADLFGKAEQAGRELGASQAELLSLTDAVAQSLLVSGVSTEQASGAILGLSQALASGTVRAEEFNQVNEGGLRVLLEAAAQSERFGGSVAKLRNEVLAGTVSSEEFFRAVLANTDLIEGRASKATLTLSGALTALNDSLARYVGESANANGVTGALTAGIQKLAENIDTVIEALAVIAVAIGARYTIAVGTAIVRTVGLAAASVSLGVALNGVAVTARAAGVALLSALGGPVGVAVGALVIGLGTLGLASRDAARDSDELDASIQQNEKTLQQYEQRLRDAGVQIDDIGDGADVAGDKMSTFAGQMLVAADAALTLARNLQVAELAKIGAQLQENDRQRFRIEGSEARSGTTRGSTAGIGRSGIESVAPSVSETTRETNAIKLERLARERQLLLRQARAIQKGVEAGVDVTGGGDNPAAPPVTRTPTTPRGTTARQGPSAADQQNRFLDEQARLDAEILQAQLALANSIEERASIERQILSQQGDQRRAEIDAQLAAKELTAEQATALKAQIDQLYGVAAQYDEQGNIIATYNRGLIAQDIARREQADIERQRLDTLEERGRAEVDALRLQFDLADTEKQRRAIALQILDAEQRLAVAREQEVIDSQAASAEAKELAKLRRDAILSQAGAEAASVKRQFADPLERFAQRAKDTDTLVAEAAVRRIEDLNQTITDAMTNALGIKDPFLSQLIKIFLDRNVFGPLAEALSQQQGGGILGGIGSLLGGLFGRASGGPVSAGRAYRVNEGASPGRVEAFIPNNSGQIIPLGRMNAMQAGGAQSGNVAVVRLQLSGDLDARIEGVSAGVAVEVVRAAAPQIVDAAANETISRASRPRL